MLASVRVQQVLWLVVSAMADGKVNLVGAVPGDPRLLTVEAMRLLQAVDVAFHGDLVSSEILDLIPERGSFGRPL